MNERTLFAAAQGHTRNVFYESSREARFKERNCVAGSAEARVKEGKGSPVPTVTQDYSSLGNAARKSDLLIAPAR
jgi:hypothetical protein